MIYESNTGHIYYEVSGPENAPVIAFTHGAGLDHHMFDAQVSAFNGLYRVLTWDMAGHGRSARLSRDFEVTQMADCLIHLLDEIGAAKAVLAGQSLGSWISQYAAHKHPDRVAAIVSIGGTPLHQDMGKAFVLLQRMMMLVYRLIPEEAFLRGIARTNAVTPEAQRGFEESLLRMGRKQFEYVWRGMLKANAGIPEAPGQPLLITLGENESTRMPRRISAKWHASTPESHYQVLPKAGHNANQDNPAAFNRTMQSFLEEIGYGEDKQFLG